VTTGDAWLGEVELELHGMTHGGEAVGRLPDDAPDGSQGKACFVAYAIPGERVRVRLVEQRKRWARGELIEVVEASADRVEPPCPYYGPNRCGGCQLQHIHPDRQAALKRQIVVDQLERIGGVTAPPVAETVKLASQGYRNTARFGVDDSGRLGFRRAGSHDIIPVDACLLLEPDAQRLRKTAGDAWHGVAEVSVRVGSGDHGGDVALVVEPGAGLLPQLPGTVPVALRDALGQVLSLRGDPSVTHQVAGSTLRVSAASFCQPNTAGAEALVRLVRQAADVSAGDTVLELFAGTGLFAAALADDGARVVAVEAQQPAAEDARENLTGHGAVVLADDAETAVSRLRREGLRPAVAVLDPPRRGAGEGVLNGLAALQPQRVVYVSCDPATLARDTATLAGAGYSLSEATPVDQFAQTAHVEIVAAFQPRQAL
jgi:tRNA/tmRNA/rRNA uracil-C5-methylase (TrmA/RlmC/RlmD family)